MIVDRMEEVVEDIKRLKNGISNQTSSPALLRQEKGALKIKT